MVQDKFIWCRNCNEIHHMSLYDKAPEYSVDQGEEIEVPMDDWGMFMKRHAGHKLQALRSVGERYCPGGKAIDPMKVEYIEVTNGNDWYVVRSFRESIEDPLSFEIVPGRLKSTGVSVQISENEIRKEMKHHFVYEASRGLDEDGIELFIKLFKEVVKDLKPNEIKVSEYTDGSAAVGELNTRLLDALRKKCVTHFPPAELDDIRRFCEAQTGSDGVMVLQIKQLYRIEQAA